MKIQTSYYSYEVYKMESAFLSCNILAKKSKIGNLKCDDNGYFEICLGAFNAYNDVGDYYVYTSNVESLINNAASLNRRAGKAALYGEFQHPKIRPGESNEAFFERALTVTEEFTSHHIKSVRLIDGKDHKGRDVKLSIGLVKPAGVHWESLDRSLRNPDENVAFSIRCLTRPYRMPNGTVAKELYHPITWDRVNEGGILEACKYNTPTLESFKEDVIITPEMLDSIESNPTSGISMESMKSTFTMIRTNLGWQKVQAIPTYSATHWK